MSSTETRGRSGFAVWFPALMELLRIPNLFTAAADVAMGVLFVSPLVGATDTIALAALVGASCLLYAAGVVLNDVFDAERDARRRPERPIPSGRIPLGMARSLGWLLLLGGTTLAWGAAAVLGQWGPGLTVLPLAGCIVLYNAFLKLTPLGPVAMGACRTLNVLLGMSVTSAPWQLHHGLVAGAIGVYIAGITWFARTEAERSRRLPLALATLVMLAGIALLGLLPRMAPPGELIRLLELEPWRWYMFLGALGLLIGWRFARAVAEPAPAMIQAAVQHGILSLIFLDAAACYAVRDMGAAVAILLLLIPATLAGRAVRGT